MAARKWTQAQRENQAKLIHKWKPWEKSTGARSSEGKAISSKNAYRYEIREVMREMARVNRALIPRLEQFMEFKAWLVEKGIFRR